MEQQGHSRVPAKFKSESGFNLGVWVWGQRQKKAHGAFNRPDRQQRLEALPDWSWIRPLADQRWEAGFAKLKQFLEQHRHSQVPFKYKTDDGFLLGRWVRWVRLNRFKLDPDRRRRLEALPRWSWATPRRGEAVWEDHFTELKQFAEREGHSSVPHYYRTQDGFKLGQWVAAQKVKFKKGKIGPDRQRHLEGLPGWVWQSQNNDPPPSPFVLRPVRARGRISKSLGEPDVGD